MCEADARALERGLANEFAKLPEVSQVPEGQPKMTPTLPMTMNVVLELVNYEFLLANNTLHQVPY